MDAVTYPDARVERLLNERTVPYKPDITRETGLAGELGVVWTPGLLWLDANGRVRHSNVGYFPPEEFLAESLFGLGQVAACGGDWKAAKDCFDRIIEQHPKTFAAPAATYWAGVAAKQVTNDVAPLLDYWKRLLKEHHGSSWASKVSFLQQRK